MFEALVDPHQLADDLPINGGDYYANTYNTNIIESITESTHENFIYMEAALDKITDHIN
jgi:hypothetical protein